MQTIRTYGNLFQAQSAKAVLEKQGIPVFLKGENVASLNLFDRYCEFNYLSCEARGYSIKR